MRPRHSLGQVFLRDRKYIDSILGCLDVDGKNVLEIGPGKGEISRYLCSRAANLCCVEIDSRFYSFLKDKFRDFHNVEIINADILQFPISKLGEKLVVFGNVPYQISSRLIDYLVQNKNCISKAYFTLQKEFGQKLTAKPSMKQYGFLSCYIQYYAKTKNIFDIPAEAFWPKPKVLSSFIEIEFYNDLPIKVADEGMLFDVIRKAFLYRRKKLSNSLKVEFEKYSLDYLSCNFNLDLSKRAADVSLEDYCRISGYFEAASDRKSKNK